ncbi:MAG: endolytic transglycosylase MltG [Bryobacteraceae bacterium]
MARRRSQFARLILGVILLAAIVLGASAWWVTTPYKGFGEDVIVDFDRGTSSRVMADKLAASGVIPSKEAFLLARAAQPWTRLQAGEYLFHDPASPWEVLKRLTRGDIHYYEFTVPEGSNLFDIAAVVSDLGTMEQADFVRAARDPKLIRDLAPQAPSLEGYLFPSTYRITRRTTADQLCRLMTDQFRKHWKQVGGAAPVHATVTLASLVEKETGAGPERPLVASVFRNRLGKGMKMECDPTTIYAALLDHRWTGVIHRSDLDSKNPYNTYQHPGLPPGPIANPGVAALKAALHPADSEYLYFVAKPGGGGHNFSAGLAAHEKAVKEYRRGQSGARKGR